MSVDRRLSRVAVVCDALNVLQLFIFRLDLIIRKKKTEARLNARNDVKLSGHTINANSSIIPSELQDSCEQRRK